MLLPICIMCLVILLLIFLLKKLHQPYLVAYILAGIILGPHITGIVNNTQAISSLGEIGVLLLMFFIGMEIEIPDKKSLLLKPLVAQGVKTFLSIAVAFFIGYWMRWNTGSILILSITMVFNSTAVVSEFLRHNNELNTDIGKTVLNILLLQDVMLAPALAVFKFWGSGNFSWVQFAYALAGSLLLFLLLRAIRNQNLFQLPFFNELDNDHELQVFAGSLLCLGFALLASYAGLGEAFGSFAAGIYIGRTDAFKWLEKVLKPFKVFFVALFFMSVGLMIDLPYIRQNLAFIVCMAILVMLINSLLSAIVFRLFKYTLRTSVYAGALLSQTGEFGLLACSLAYKTGIIDTGFFKAAVGVMGLSLLLSTGWITFLRKVIYRSSFMFSKQNSC